MTSMEYLRVEVPVLNVKSLRDAETGEEIAMEVYSRDDKLLAESGDELTPEDIRRFQNFRVRAIATLGFQTRWVPGDKESQLSPRAEVVERADFSDAIAEIVDSLQGRESLEYLVDMTQYLRRVATRLGREERKQQLDNLLEQAQSVQDDYESILDDLEEIDDEQARERIEEVMFDSSASTDDSFMELPVDDGLLKRVIKASNQRLQVIAPLVDIANDLADEMGIDVSSEIDVAPFPADYKDSIRELNEQQLHSAIELFPEGADNDWKDELHQLLSQERKKTMDLIEDVKEMVDAESAQNSILGALEGEKSLNPKILDSLIPDNPDLANRISGLMEQRVDNRSTLWDRLDEVSEGIMSDRTEQKIFMTVTNCLPEERTIDVLPPDTAIDEAREKMQAGEYLDAIHRLVEGLREIDAEQTTLEGELMVYGEQFEELLSRRAELEDDIEQTVEKNEKQRMLTTVLNERENYQPDHLLNIDADVMLLENIDTYKTEELDKLRQFDDYFNELKKRARNQ